MKATAKIYGAYGSNMNIEQMKRRCPNAKVIGKGQAKDYTLTFRGINNGVANIEESPSDTAPIVLWEITDKCERALDIYEGYPKLYVKKNIDVFTEKGIVTAMVYVMAKEYENLPAKPSKYYFDAIWRGYQDNNIPTRTLTEAVARNNTEILS